MGSLTLLKLLNAWQREEITAEMAIGQLIQQVIKLETALTKLNLTLYHLRAEVDSLIAQAGLPPERKRKK